MADPVPPSSSRAAETRAAEAALVVRCAEGDRESWMQFVAAYGPLIAALSRRMLERRTGRAGPADVDEVMSQVFLALCRGERRLLRRYRPEFRLSTYLGVICRTEVSKWLRRSGSSAVSLSRDPDEGGGEPPVDPAAESPFAALARRERDDAILSLRAALDRLPGRERLLLKLRYIDGLDYGRIAEVLRIQRDSVGQLLHRAKQRLARMVPELEQWVEASRKDE